MSTEESVVKPDHVDVHIKPGEERQWHDDGELTNTIKTIELEERNNKRGASEKGQGKVLLG